MAYINIDNKILNRIAEALERISPLVDSKIELSKAEASSTRPP